MDFKVKLIVIILTLIVSIVGWKMYSLYSEIGYLNKTIVTKDKDILELNMSLLSSLNNVKTLQLDIEKSNVLIYKQSEEHDKLINEVNLWKEQPPEIKYVDKVVKTIVTQTKYVKGVCEDGLELNRMIGGLKYEDLK